MNFHIDTLDRSGGNGSRSTKEDWLNENSTASENEWSKAETTFYYWEAPDDKQHIFKELYDKHHGKDDSNRSSELPRMRALADARAFCSMLDLSNNLQERVLHIMERIEIDSKKFGGKSYEKIILAVIILTHDQHLSSQPPQNIEYEQRLIFDDTFRDLMESNNLGSKELRSVREQIRTKTDFF